MTELVKMIRGDSTADVHPEMVREYSLHGWESEVAAEPESAVAADLAGLLAQKQYVKRPTVAEASKELKRKVSGEEIAVAWDAIVVGED